MQFTVLAVFAAASLVVASPMPGIDPVVITNVGLANAGLQVRAKTKSNAPAPLRVGSDDSFQTNSCNGTTSIYLNSDLPLISVPPSSC